MELVLKNGLVIDAQGKRQADIWVKDGRIAEIGHQLVRPGAVVDIRGKIILPGFIDLHTHLREPGQEGKETIATGTAAAAKGGFTTLCAMPNTEPAIDSPLMVELVKVRAKSEGWVRVLPVGAITKGRQGKELAEIGLMYQAGAVAYTDDGDWVQDSGVMLNAMRYAAQWDLLIISHPEDNKLSAGGVLNAGPLATRLGLKGIPAVTEVVAVERDIALAEATGCRLHLTHLSTAGSVRAVRAAKARGLRVTADVTPHHLLLTEDCCDNYNTLAKVNPPLRTKADSQALLEGLLDGTIDAIATDHAPHKDEEKFTTFDDAPFGIIGLEHSWGLLYANLVETGLISLAQLAALLTQGPSLVLGLEAPCLSPGSLADITVIDPATQGQVDLSQGLSKGKNSPFGGWATGGQPVLTIVGGRVVMMNGIVGEIVIPLESRAQVV
jgi:dihydroorotase